MATVPTDLVIVIDTSGSMQTHAAKLSSAASGAITKAKDSCKADLRVKWFGIEGTWPGTKFARSYRSYLNAKGVGDSRLAKRQGGAGQGDQEDGAAAAIDLASFFDWRPGALRTILYLGDEGLAQGDPNETTDDVMKMRAIDRANEEGVVVYTYCASSDQSLASDYRELAEQTEGVAFGGNAEDLAQQIETVFHTVVCKTIETNKPKGKSMTDNLSVNGVMHNNQLREDEDWTRFIVTVKNTNKKSAVEKIRVHAKAVYDDDSPVKIPGQWPSVALQPSYGYIDRLEQQGTKSNGQNLDTSTLYFLVGTTDAKGGKYKIQLSWDYTYPVENISETDPVPFEIQARQKNIAAP